MESNEAWTAERFLDTLNRALGGTYRRCADDCFSWLTPFDEVEHERLANVARHGVRRLDQLIPGLHVTAPSGGWPAILFDTTDAQLAYEGIFGGSGQHIISGGCYRARPIGHLAIPVSSQDSLDAAFAHELVHALLCPRGVPNWFQEGIACEVETRLGNRTNPFNNRRRLDEMVAYWRQHDPESFWSAQAFGHPDSSRHAYALAQVLVGRWTRDPAALERVCSLGPEQWRDQEAALGVPKAWLIGNVIEPAKPRGWMERVLYAIFVDDAK